MRAERLGSYSIEMTVAGIPVLSRLKSIRRSLRLFPPPRNRLVMSPEFRRPPVFSLASTSGLYGFLVGRSSFNRVVLERKGCVVGLYVLIAIIALSSQRSAFSDSLIAAFRDFARTPASFRRPSTARTPSSNRDGSPRNGRGAALFPDSWRCAPNRPSL